MIMSLRYHTVKQTQTVCLTTVTNPFSLIYAGLSQGEKSQCITDADKIVFG